MTWHVHRNGTTSKLDELALRRAIVNKDFSEDTLVWRQGMAEWLPISSLIDKAASVPRQTHSPAVLLLLVAIVAGLAVAHIRWHADLLDTFQERLGALLSVSFIALFAMCIATAGAGLAIFLWQHPKRRDASGFAGSCFLIATLAAIFEMVILGSFLFQAPDVYRLSTAIATFEDARISAEGVGVVGIHGTLGPNLLRDFNRAEAAHGPIRVVELTSPGGLVDPALQLADLFESKRISVVVRGQCDSACIALAVASPSAYSEADVIFGFHKTSPVAEAHSEIVLAILEETWKGYRQYLLDHGVPSSVLDEAEKYGPSSAHPVTALDMVRYGAIEGIVPGGESDISASR